MTGTANRPARHAQPVRPGGRPAVPARSSVVRMLPWAGAAALVTATALVLSGTGPAATPPPAMAVTAGSDAADSLQLTLVSVEGVRAVVAVSAEQAPGPLELHTSTAGGTEVTYPLLDVPAGGMVRTEVVVPRQGRTTITINDPGQSQPRRTLVVDR